MPPAACIAAMAAMTDMMMPMTSKGISSPVTGAPAIARAITPRPPAAPIAMDPYLAPSTMTARTISR